MNALDFFKTALERSVGRKKAEDIRQKTTVSTITDGARFTIAKNVFGADEVVIDIADPHSDNHQYRNMTIVKGDECLTISTIPGLKGALQRISSGGMLALHTSNYDRSARQEEKQMQNTRNWVVSCYGDAIKNVCNDVQPTINSETQEIQGSLGSSTITLSVTANTTESAILTICIKGVDDQHKQAIIDRGFAEENNSLIQRIGISIEATKEDATKQLNQLKNILTPSSK